MSKNAVSRLTADIHRYQQAQKTRASDAHALRHDEGALKSDQKQGQREHDRFDKDQKALKKDHAKLLSTRNTEQEQLKPLQSQEAQLQAQYDASVDPTTGQGDPSILAQLNDVKQQISDVQGKFDPKIASESQQVDALRKAVQQGRLDIRHTRADIKHERSAVKHDKTALGRAQSRVKSDHRRALKDLRPAEYKMGLKATNQARHALGLKSVHQVIRPSAGLSKVVDLAKKYLGKYESQLQAEGVTQPCPTSESCANFVTSMLYKEHAINFRTLNVADLNNRLRGAGWHVVSLKDAKPGDVWICNGAGGEQHTEIVASNHNGHVTLIGSNNHPNPGNQQINYDSYSASISGSFILAPPGH